MKFLNDFAKTNISEYLILLFGKFGSVFYGKYFKFSILIHRLSKDKSRILHTLQNNENLFI